MAELLAIFRTPQSELIRLATLSRSTLSWKLCCCAPPKAKSWRIRRSMLLYQGLTSPKRSEISPAVRAQVLVLLDEGVQRGPLLVRRDVGAAVIDAGIELDLTLVTRDVDQIVPALAVPVHIPRVDEGVAVAAGAGEAAALGDLDEHTDRGPQTGRPGLHVGAAAHDPVPLAELGEAELGVVRIALHRLVLPEHARDLGGLEGVLGLGVAVGRGRAEPEGPGLPELGGDVEGVPLLVLSIT